MHTNDSGLQCTSAHDSFDSAATSLNSTSVNFHQVLPFRVKAIYISISLFGFVSNVFVITVIRLNSEMMNQVMNVFIINQSAVDALAAIFLFFTALFYRDSRNFTPGNPADDAACRFWYSVMPLWSCLLASTYGIMVLTFEKFLAVVYPINYRTRFCNNRLAIRTLLAAPWFIGTSFNLAAACTTAAINSDGECLPFSHWPNTQTQNGVGIVTVFLEYFIPIFFMVFCYSKMAVVLHRRVEPTPHDSVAAAAAPGGGELKRNESMARARSNTIKTLLLLSVLFVVCWTPNIIYLLMSFLGYPYIDYAGDFYTTTVCMVFFSCCVNPVAYATKYKPFQKAVRRLVCRIRVDDDEFTNTEPTK